MTTQRPGEPVTPAQMEIVRAVADALRIPVFANGGSLDMQTYEDVLAFRDAAGCSSVMVARAAQHNLSIFRKEGGWVLAWERAPSSPSKAAHAASRGPAPAQASARKRSWLSSTSGWPSSLTMRSATQSTTWPSSCTTSSPCRPAWCAPRLSCSRRPLSNAPLPVFTSTTLHLFHHQSAVEAKSMEEIASAFGLLEYYQTESSRQAALAKEHNFFLGPTDDQLDEVAGTVLAHLSKKGALPADEGEAQPAKRAKADEAKIITLPFAVSPRWRAGDTCCRRGRHRAAPACDRASPCIR